MEVATILGHRGVGLEGGAPGAESEVLAVAFGAKDFEFVNEDGGVGEVDADGLGGFGFELVVLETTPVLGPRKAGLAECLTLFEHLWVEFFGTLLPGVLV